MRTLYLASQSQARHSLLQSLGDSWDLKIAPSDCPENLSPSLSLEDAIAHLAFSKGNVCLKNLQNTHINTDYIIIAADTMIRHNSQWLGKANYSKEAYNMIKSLSGTTHKVYTGIWVYNSQNKEMHQTTVISFVDFLSLSDKIIKDYINSNEWKGAAGSYRLQGQGAFFVKSISGSYSNIIGFPLETIVPLFEQWELPLFT